MNRAFPLESLLLGDSLPSSEWKNIFLSLFRRKLTTPESKILLLLMARIGEDGKSAAGCLQALRRLEPPKRINLPFLIDVCGTGGDGRHTFNISTVSSFVIAGAGGYVAKHGNRSVSSKVGSSDLMEALGVRIEVPFSQMMKALRQSRLAYFHAPLYHPSFSYLQPLRRELGIRTLFNLLGPLVNPVQLGFQVIGVSNAAWLLSISEAAKFLNRRRAAVLRSEDGLDELSTRSSSDILYLEGRKIKKMKVSPAELGFKKPGKHAYEGGDLATNRRIALGILEGRLRGPEKDIVLLNSGFALWIAGLAPSIKEGIEKSRWSIRTARALQALEGLRRISKERN